MKVIELASGTEYHARPHPNGGYIVKMDRERVFTLAQFWDQFKLSPILSLRKESHHAETVE